MTDSTYTHLVLVVDCSSSMSSIRDEARDTLNEFVAEQRKVDGKCTVTYVQFASHVKTVYSNVPLDDLPKLDLIPSGMTALNDAFGLTIERVGNDLVAMPEHERPGKVLFLLVTDGGENASREFSSDKVRKLVSQQKGQYGWDFVFVGANQDAILAGARYGINRGSTLTFNASGSGVTNAGAAMNAYATQTRSGLIAGFTEAQRTAAVDNN